MNRQKLIALLITLLLAVGALVTLCLTHLTAAAKDRTWPPQRQGQVTVADEEMYFDVIEMPHPLSGVPDEASPAYNETEQDNLSEPEPVSGSDLADAGQAGKPQTPVTAKRPASVKQKVNPAPEKPGPAADNEQNGQVRRRANSNVKGAFDRADGRQRTQNPGKTPGDSGSPDGTDNTYHGHAQGKANGGWIVPAYRKIPSTVTGSIKVRVVIGRDGSVKEISFIDGGKAPAATDRTLREAVKAEILKRRYTRTDDKAPERAVGVITYIFE